MHGEAPRRVKKEPSNEQQQQQQPSPSKQTNNNSMNAGGSRREMFDSFHMWALKTYGDSAKTKTVTRKKYARIMKILKGEEQNSAENSKFRFWVKAKGFRIGPPVEAVSNHRGDQVLYVPCVQTKNPVGKEETIYKKVAVVENFFDIIYNVHVEMDGRGGKHAGQKRTYKAIAETFAFLPREAVTKFLMQCADCQKRMHAGSTPGETHSSPTAATPSSTSTGIGGGGGARNPKTTANTSGSNPALGDPNCLHDNGGGNNGTFNGILNTSNNNITGNGTTTTSGGLNGNGHGCTTPPQIDFSLPITTTYLKHMRSLGYSEEDALNLEREVHFDENQFEMGRLDRKKKLRPNATPTLFGDPTDEEQPSKRRRKQPLPQKTAAASATEDELPESGLHEEKGGQGDLKVSEERGRRRRRNVKSVYGTLSAERESPKKECTSIVDSDSRGSHSTPPGDSDCSPPPQIKEEAESPSRAISPCVAPVGMRTSSLNGTTAHFSAEHSYDKPVNMTKAQVDVVTSSPVPLSSSPSSSCPPAAPATPSAVTPVPVTPSNGWQAASASPLNMSKNGDVMITRDHAADARSLQDHTYDESVVMMVLPSPRAQSPCSGRLGRESTATPEDLSGGNKDEDDDEDDDNDDKLDIHKYDPERLKAFNMFVRLFVDENLDRMVPISKQPKEKIQAIIDSCNRQFPEFAERARKRIRTYLKSCRRTKRTRDQNGWDLIRPTPPHLTSAMAEQILAAACENESHNAKRMRLGLEPISATIQAIQGADKESSSSSPLVNDRARCSLEGVNQPMDTSLSPAHGCLSPSPSPLPRASPPHLNGTLPSNTPAYPTATALNTAVSPTGHSNGTQSQILRSYLQRPTDLSLKKPPSHQSSTAKCNLNPSEVLAVKQLIAGYRESAAFLIRSADELEQLLLQQN